MATLFGKNYQEVGKSSSPLLLKSSGEIKLQWGNKFIDLIKNGKLAIQSKSFIQTIDNADSIIDTGIYLVTTDNSIWLSIDGNKQTISNTDNSYISFATTQNITNEQKTQALTNIGFYYNTLEDAKNANIQNGFIYVLDTNKLYVVSNSSIQEFTIQQNNTFDSITIGNTTISKDILNIQEIVAQSIVTQNLTSNQATISSINTDNIVSDSFKIQNKNGKSTLKVDSISWTNMADELPQQDINKFKYTINGEYNIITDFQLTKTVDGSYYEVQANLKYINTFKPVAGNPLYLNAEIELNYNQFILTNNGNIWLFNKAIPVADTVSLTLLDDTKVAPDTIGSDYFITDKTFKDVTFVNHPDYIININTSYIQYDPTEIQVDSYDSTSFTFTIEFNLDLLNDILANKNCKVYQARVNQYIISDTYSALRSYDGNKYKLHTVMGTYTKEELGIDSEDEDKKDVDAAGNPVKHFGFYSDDLIVDGISMDNAVFSGKLPSYTGDITEAVDNELPTMSIVNNAIKDSITKLDIDTIIENMNKQLVEAKETAINAMLPIGTIIMFNNSSNIPEGWHICNGLDGTPNLIDKFIKGGLALLDIPSVQNTTKVTKPNESDETIDVLTEVKSLQAYSLIFIMKIK